MKTYIAVGNIDFLENKNFLETFQNGTEDQIREFCDNNYDREDYDLSVYSLDGFIEAFNNNNIDEENSYIRKFTK